MKSERILLQNISNILSSLICMLLAALIGMIFLSGKLSSKNDSDEIPESDRNIRVNTMEVKPDSSFKIVREFSSLCKARKGADLSFQKGGTISDIRVSTGSEIKKNAILAETESGESLKAPFDGIVGTRLANEGSFAGPGMPVIRLVNRDELEATFDIPVDYASEVESGDPFNITIGEKSYVVPVSGISPEVNPDARTRTFVFEFSRGISSKHLPGEVAKLELSTISRQEGFWVPLSALTRETRGLWSVFAIEKDDKGGSVIKRHFVEMIHLEDQQARVAGTLKNQTRIVKDGTHRVVPGQKVNTVPAAKPVAKGKAG